ncbi:hypothetical protein Tco_1184718 [Tanacetum coccineum]
MTSLDRRLNPLYAIKECSSCGNLHTKECGCSKGSLEDKILVLIPDLSQRPLKIEKICLDCGDPVHGLYFRQCALIRKTLEEVFQDFQDTSKSSNDDTNFVNQEPFVVKQGPGVNSLQSPPQINHNCCYKCGDSLDDIFFQRCTCKSYGKGAHYGYNCPSQIPIISNPEPCYNQNLNEILQNLQSLQQQCLFVRANNVVVMNMMEFVFIVLSEMEHQSNFQLRTILTILQVLQTILHNPNMYHTLVSYVVTILITVTIVHLKSYCGGPHETFQCQPMNEDYYHEQNSCYDSNSLGFDQTQPPQYTVNHPISNVQNSLFNAQNEFLNSQNKLMEQMTSICDMIPICYDDDEDYTIAITPISSTKEPVNSLSMGDEHLDTIPATESDKVIKSSVEDLVPIPSESKGIPDSVCDVPLCNNPTPLEAFKEHSETIIDSNNDYSSSDDDSYENINYVDASPPDAEIVSSEVVEIVVPEVGGIDDDILLTIKDDILREKLLNVNLLIANIEALKDNPTPSSDVMTKSSSTSLNLFLEETNTFDNSLTESFCFDLEEVSSSSPITHSDYSLPNYEAFYSDDDHIEEKSSGSTTTHADFSKYDSFIFDLSINPFPPADRSDFHHEEFADELAHIISPSEYDHFCFKIEPELGNLTMDVVEDISQTSEPRIHVPNVLSTHPTLDTNFILLRCPGFLKPLVLAVFVLRSQELHNPQLHLGIPIS